MKKSLAIVMIFMLCLLTGCKAMQYMKDGTDALKAGAYDDAIGMFQAAIENDVEDVGDAYKGIGFAYYEKGEFEQALSAFDMALEKGTESNPAIHHLRGICYMKLEDYANALEAFEQGIASAEGAETSYAEILQEMKFNEIICCEKLLDWAAASEKAEAYILLYPDDQAAQKEAQFLRTR